MKGPLRHYVLLAVIAGELMTIGVWAPQPWGGLAMGASVALGLLLALLPANTSSDQAPRMPTGGSRSGTGGNAVSNAWQKAVGQSLNEHYWKSKGRDPAHSQFMMELASEMQRRHPGTDDFAPAEVEAVRRQLEPQVISKVRVRYPNFSPQRKSLIQSR